jgi:uncharacterized protein (TIRG00374 family)
MRFYKFVMYLSLVVGFALLGVMIWQVGVVGLLESFHLMGLWIVPFLLLKTLPLFLHTAGWAACFPGRRPPLRLWQLFMVRQAGSAISQVTPTATIGGEVTKVLLLEHSMPQEQATAAIVIDKASITLAKMVYLALGMLYVMYTLPLPTELQLSLYLSIGLISLGLMGFIAFQRYGALSKLVQGLERFRIAQQKLQWLNRHLVRLDRQLVTYYTHYPWRFVCSLLLHFTAYLSHTIRTYIVLRLLLGIEATGFPEAFMITVVVAALDQLFFFVPGQLGTLEGARFLVLSLLGVAQIYGLTFGLIARIDVLVWHGLGLLFYALCTGLPVLPAPKEL